MAASRCFCCGKPLSPGGSRACAVVLFIICWYMIGLQSSLRYWYSSQVSTKFDLQNAYFLVWAIYLLLPCVVLNWLFLFWNSLRVFFFIAEVCLLAGSVRNAYHTKYRTFFEDNPPSCQTIRKGVFAAGAAFIFLTGIVSEFYYVNYSRARESFQPYGAPETDVGMGTYK